SGRQIRAARDQVTIWQSGVGGIVKGEVEVCYAMAATSMGHQEDVAASRTDQKHVHVTGELVAQAVQNNGGFVNYARKTGDLDRGRVRRGRAMVRDGDAAGTGVRSDRRLAEGEDDRAQIAGSVGELKSSRDDAVGWSTGGKCKRTSYGGATVDKKAVIS